MKYYIADTHFGHANIMKYDKRPWDDVDRMDEDMIVLWNSRVRPNDEVYILGDFCWRNYERWEYILKKLHGRKYLITGNHDPKKFPEHIISLFETAPVAYKEIRDGSYSICMSHFPMISYINDNDPMQYMFHGHIHMTLEAGPVYDAVETMRAKCKEAGFFYQGNLRNCWCGNYGWAPATAEEIIAFTKGS
ncbi:MAG: metallophosphoesterase [Clostridiales bacterium]|nr:metallophosphoesterase [Clostridiales bacterium]